MKIKQTYTIKENIYGNQTINIILTDVYTELFTSTSVDYNTDILQIETIKEDLEASNFALAVDELQFTINGASVNTEDDKNVMFFCLDASEPKIKRYISVYLGDINIDNLLFTGMIESKISGEDIVHHKADWVDNLGVVRDYKFTALSIDFALLEECVFKGDIFDKNGTKIDNIYDRISSGSYSALNFISNNYKCYDLIDTRKQVNLYDALNLYLEKANDLLNELYGINVEFSFDECELGFEATPLHITYNSHQHVGALKPDTNQVLRIKLMSTPSSTIDGVNYSTFFIHRGLITSMVYYSDDKDNIEWEKERSFSWEFRFKNVAELLYNLARNYGCIVTKTITETSINIKFKPKKDISLNNSIKVIGANQASLDLDNEETEEKVIYKEEANYMYFSSPLIYRLTISHLNLMTIYDNKKSPAGYGREKLGNENYKFYNDKTKIWETISFASSTSAYLLNKDFIKEREENNKDIKIYDFPTSSAELIVLKCNTGINYIPLQTILEQPMLFNTKIATNPEDDTYSKFIKLQDERVTSMVQVYCKEPVDEFNSTEDNCLRPIARILSKYNDENIEVGNFTEYLGVTNQIANEKYNTKYTFKVPYLNSFSENVDGSNPSWSNIKLGANITIKEDVKRYNGTTFESQTITNDFMIVGIERDLKGIATNLTLVLQSKYAYGYNDSLTYDDTEVSMIAGDETYNDVLDINGAIIENYPIQAGETIIPGDPVSINGSNEIELAKLKSSDDARFLGICFRVKDNFADIAVDGSIGSDDWNFNIGDKIYVRKNPTLQLTHNRLASPNIDEDLVIYVGEAITEHKLIINKYQIKYGRYVLA